MHHTPGAGLKLQSRRAFNWLAMLLAVCAVSGLKPSTALGQDWPLADAYWTIELNKDANSVPPPHEPSDILWFHLHRNHPVLPDALVNTIAPTIIRGYEELDPAASNIQIRYFVHGVPISDWLNPPFRYVLSIDNPALAQLKDGIHDLSIDVRGATRNDFKPQRAFVHLSRDMSRGEPFGFSRDVPIINATQERSNLDPNFGPGVVYVNPSDRNHVGFPLNEEVVAWTERPDQASLYQELMGPHTELFQGVQMWWDHPAHANAPFVRSMAPKHGEDHRSLRVDHAHERFPMQDGPRGVGWMSPYVSGQVDSKGRLAFAETGGRVGYLMPDGEIITVAGWRVKVDKDPIWFGKPTAQVRQNMENRGRWLNGRGEMRTPLDIAIDPRNENIWYVAAYEDHVIWKVTLPANPRTEEATVSVFAGSPQHLAGSTDGNGFNARFNGPASIVFDPVNDVMYVADQDNDAIRTITRDGDVTTLFSSEGMRDRLIQRGVDWTDQIASRNAGRFIVSAQQASQGIKPDIYLPQTIRVDSRGRIILLGIGYGAIRRIDPNNGQTENLGEVRQKHRQFDRGWAWMDVDRYGNSGPIDGIYWCKFVSTLDGENFNEVFRWLPADGGDSVALFSRGTGLYPDGWGRLERSNPPHYPWLVAVDPRGAVLLSGGGEHGITRLRRRTDSDPIEGQDYWLGRQIWKSGSSLENPEGTNSFALKHGFGGHNHLGLTNAWGLEGASDEQLLTAFEAGDSVRNDAITRDRWLQYIRPNTIGSRPDQSPLTLSVTGSQVSEGSGRAIATVSLNRSAQQVVRVSVATNTDNSAEAGRDYFGMYRQLEFGVGEREKQVAISILDDSEIESTETFRVRIFNATGADIANAFARISIDDNDSSGGDEGFSISAVRVDEGDVAVIRVQRTGPNTSSASVNVSTATIAGGATPGQDHYGFHEELQFAAGESVKQLTLTTLEDALVESDEQIRLRLFRPTGDVIANANAILTIVDDD